MSGKMKTLLVVLALGALVSVSYLLAGFKKTNLTKSGTASIFDGTISSDPCHRDTDKDTLSDCEESYWETDPNNPDSDGDKFTDGEELASGHDPRKKGPDDLLGSRGNVTQQAATLMLGALTVGDLDPSSPNYVASIHKLSDAVIENYRANSQVRDEEVLLGPDQQSDVIKYGFTISNIIEPAFKNLSGGYIAVIKTVANTNLQDLSKLNTTNPNEYKAFIAAIDQQISSIESSVGKLRKISVPPSMVVAHKNMVTLLRGSQQQYRLLRQISQDPVQGMFAFQSLSGLTGTTVADVAQDFTIRLNTALTRK